MFELLKKIFGYRTDKAPSSALTQGQLTALGAGIVAGGQMFGRDLIMVEVANTNSMLPLLDSNALLICEACEYEDLREGDMAVYHRSQNLGGGLVVHNLNERRPKGWWPLGLNNKTMDLELVTPANFYRRVCGILYGEKTAETDK